MSTSGRCTECIAVCCQGMSVPKPCSSKKALTASYTELAISATEQLEMLEVEGSQ